MTRLSLLNRAKEDVRKALGDYAYHLQHVGRPVERMSFGALRAMLKHQICVLQRVAI